MNLKAIIPLCRDYVTSLFETKLGKNFSFHNLKHTKAVVNAVQEISLNSKITSHDKDILTIAAWFHDTGYIYAYFGHEICSTRIACDFLTLYGVKTELIERINSCIIATRFPQEPKNKMENILCDADLHHFSKPEYPTITARLRNEWQLCVGTFYTDSEWDAINLKMLNTHVYLTGYGRTVLQDRKNRNIFYLDTLVSR